MVINCSEVNGCFFVVLLVNDGVIVYLVDIIGV